MRPETRLTPGCPWYELAELRPPNVDWCELERCAWVVEPANTWSNLAYVGVGIALLWLARDAASREVRFFGPAALIVGVSSGIYHASTTFVLQVLDFLAMYVFCFLLLTVNARRAGWLRAEAWPARFAQLVVGTTLLTVAVDFLEVPIQGLVFLLILAIVGSELWLRRREPAGASFGFFLLAMALIAGAAVFSLLDVTRTWCDPRHPFLQGHAIWHVLSAASLFAAWLHYRQFDEAHLDIRALINVAHHGIGFAAKRAVVVHELDNDDIALAHREARIFRVWPVQLAEMLPARNGRLGFALLLQLLDDLFKQFRVVQQIGADNRPDRVLLLLGEHIGGRCARLQREDGGGDDHGSHNQARSHDGTFQDEVVDLLLGRLEFHDIVGLHP